jgi:hypothetical protein
MASTISATPLPEAPPAPTSVQATPVYMAEPVPQWQRSGYNTVLLTVPYRAPVNPALSGLQPLTPREDYLLKVYGNSRIVRIIAIIDIVFTVIYGIFFPLQLVFLLFPILGVCATQRFSAWMAFIYAFFLFLQLAARIVLITVFHDLGIILFMLIGIILEFIIFSFVFSFGVQCSRLTADDRSFLADSEAIRYLRQSSWC